MDQRDFPGPAAVQCSGDGLRPDAFYLLGRQYDSRIIEQVLRKRPERNLQRLLEQCPSKTGAIDEEIGFDYLAVFCQQAGNTTVGRLLHIHHPGLQVLYAARFGDLFQIRPDVLRWC